MDIEKAIKSYPEKNSTELAQFLAGGFRGDRYPVYVSILHKINRIKGGRKG